MKKLFLLIPALILSMMMNANVINITPTSPYDSHDNLRLALYYANAGDEIVLADGTYDEHDDYLYFNKDITVRAAEGAHPVIDLYTYAQIKTDANVTIDGLKFNGAAQGSYSYYIRFYDASHTSLHLNNCEFYSVKNYVLFGNSASHTDECNVNNCYFHNNVKNAVYFEASATEGVQTCDKLVFTNSTVVNTDALTNWTSIIDVRPYGSNMTDAIKVIIDHCTFYNNPTVDSGHADIRLYKLSDATVSNCIFAHPEEYARRATYNYGGTISNCLTYNLTYDASRNAHRQDGGNPVLTNNFTADPLFTDAANGDFSFAGNWVTMELSPARGAATDGSDLGDPRWYSAEVLPSTDFASPYQFVGAKAQIAGNLWYDDVNGYLYYNDKSENGVATWKINATRACILAATLNMNAATTTGHKFKVEVLDADGNSVGETAEPSQVSTAGDIALPDQIVLPAAGKYTVKLYNLTSWSSAKIDGITLSYVGGEVQAMPATTNIDDAWFSSNGTRTAGEYISIPAGHQDEGWVKWNVSFAETANYNVTVNINNENGHNYTVALYTSETDENPITVTEGAQKSTIGTLELGAMEVPAGNYIMKVTNATKWSDAKLISVKFEYAGGAAVDLSKDAPANLLANADAIVSDDWSIEGGKIVHPESKALTGWAKWNVNSADYGNYNVTVNIASDNGHLVRVEIFEDETAAPIYTLDETSATQYHTGDQAIDLGNIVLDAREYVVKVSNTGPYSHVQIASIVISYLNGARATLPASCAFADVMLSEKAHVTDGNLWFNTIGDSNPVGQWAKWNVKAAAAGTFLFTMNVSSTNGQSYKISILDMNENELDAFESGSVGSGDKEVKHYFNLAAGNYIVKLENTYAWSQGHIVSLAVTQPELLVLDQMAATNAVIHDNYRNGNHDIQIIRSIVPNMYNTICLPFDVNSTQLTAIFGSDVELKEMSAATLNGNELTLNFSDVTSINRGTPYLIKTTKAVVNPVFTAVEIKAEEGDVTVGDAASFKGNFIMSEVPAGDHNLFLGQNDLLYFSQDATPIKGMRAYFHVDSPSYVIQRVRIVEADAPAVTTDINLLEVNASVKTIENGQLVIIKNGVKYNVMGIKLQ